MTQSFIVKVVCVILIFVGIIFVAVGVGVSISEKKKKSSCTYLVMAEIIDMRKSVTSWQDHSKTVSWYPVYQYYIYDEVLTVNSNIGHYKPVYEVGDRVEIYVDPRHPDIIYDPTRTGIMVGKIFIVVGALLGICSVVAIRLLIS